MEFGAKHSILDRIVFWGICALLVFAPLAFGSVHVWAYTIIEISVFGFCLILVLDRVVFSKADYFVWVKTPVNWILLLLLSVIILQAIPIPKEILSYISFQTFADKSVVNTILAQAGTQLPDWHHLAYYRHPVIKEGLKLAAYVGMFFLVLHAVRSKRRINILIYVLIGVGITETLYAVYQVFSDTPTVWWWKSRAGGGRYASGTFIGSNHFAGYMEMMVPLAIGFMLAHRQRSRRLMSGLGGKRAVLQRVVGMFGPESSWPRMVFLFFCSTIMGVALLLSASRGGITSLAASLLMVSLLFFFKKRFRFYGMFSLLFCIIALVYGANVGMDPTLRKFGNSNAGLEKRLYTFESIYPMLEDYTVFGVGWGNFRYLYPRYVPEDFDGVSSSGYSHNDWLEAGIEAGFVGLGLIIAAFILFLLGMVRTWQSRSDPYALGIGAGVMVGILSLGLHSLGDFNMHIPANPMTLAALSALGYTALHLRKKGIQDSFFYRTGRIPSYRSNRIFISFAMVLIFASGSVFAGRHFLAEANCASEWNSTMNLNWKPHLSEIDSAIALNPLNAEYHWKKAGYFVNSRVKTEESRKAMNEAAIVSLEEAARLNPARGLYWFYLGKRYSLKSYDPDLYIRKWLPMADSCFDYGLTCAPKDSTLLFDVAWYWVWRSSILPGNEGSVPDKKEESVRFRKDGVRKFQSIFKRSLTLNPDRWKQAADRVWEYYPDDAIVLGIVPESDVEMKSEVLRYMAKKTAITGQ